MAQLTRIRRRDLPARWHLGEDERPHEANAMFVESDVGSADTVAEAAEMARGRDERESVYAWNDVFLSADGVVTRPDPTIASCPQEQLRIVNGMSEDRRGRAFEMLGDMTFASAPEVRGEPPARSLRFRDAAELSAVYECGQWVFPGCYPDWKDKLAVDKRPGLTSVDTMRNVVDSIAATAKQEDGLWTVDTTRAGTGLYDFRELEDTVDWFDMTGYGVRDKNIRAACRDAVDSVKRTMLPEGTMIVINPDAGGDRDFYESSVVSVFQDAPVAIVERGAGVLHRPGMDPVELRPTGDTVASAVPIPLEALDQQLDWKLARSQVSNMAAPSYDADKEAGEYVEACRTGDASWFAKRAKRNMRVWDPSLRDPRQALMDSAEHYDLMADTPGAHIAKNRLGRKIDQLSAVVDKMNRREAHAVKTPLSR